MIRAELLYNPYILETEVRFNGNPPSINSLVEKYQNGKLQTWVKQIPGIFYDEMNGFDFDLDFSGTKLDFNELKNSFSQAGVDESQVRLFHKGELAERGDKVKAVDSLLQWLDDNPNRKFDTAAFREENKDLFDGAYSFVIIGNPVSNDSLFEDIDLHIDNVENVRELRKTDLESVPIIFWLDEKTVLSLQDNLVELLKRPDINQNQLFFMVVPALQQKTERIIRDLGVKEPQIVERMDDGIIHKYLEIYPVSDYIYDAIQVFREQTDSIGRVLEEENRQSEITNKDVHDEIQDLENKLIRLKTAYDSFVNKDNLIYPVEFTTAKAELISALNRWRAKKTKIVKKEEAENLSNEFARESQRLFERFKDDINKAFTSICEEQSDLSRIWYTQAWDEESKNADSIIPDELPEYSIPDISSDLMNINEDQYVAPKEALLDKLFKSSQEEQSPELVLETIYYCEKWREHALNVVNTVADAMTNEAFELICDYSRRITDYYLNAIEDLIGDVSSKKEMVASRLSEDERLLQADNDWHTTFCDKLREIERF